jgi:hypothetical protein
MDAIKKFITEARSHEWDDAKIKEALQESGWKTTQIEAGLLGMDVPLAPTAAASVPAIEPSTKHADEHGTAGRPSITALQAALHHVLLWVFTLTSTIMIGVVAAALFGGDSSSSETLLTYLVLELVTFTPFALLYWRYLRRLKQEPELMTGKVWSIITVVLHSLGLIASIVGFILVIILVHNGATTPGLVSTATIGVMDGLVVAAYVWANFAKNPHAYLRKRFLQFFPVMLFVLIAALGVVALTRVGSLRADDQTKQDLVSTVAKIHNYANDNKRLPDTLGQVADVPHGVSYHRQSDSTYEVCATFKKQHSLGYSSNHDDYPADDSYVDTYTFGNAEAGNDCWSFENATVRDVPSRIKHTNIQEQLGI